DYADAFANYTRGNLLSKRGSGYDVREAEEFATRSRATLTHEFFEARKDSGNPAPDPTFIVGMPRSGSTLVEQILSSHSAVEGTMELTNILALADKLGSGGVRYPEVLADLDRDELRRLGDEFLEQTRVYRKLGRPYFIDKMPNNFLHTGLIHLIL